MQLTINGAIRMLQRNEYIRAMRKTECGWKAKGEYSHVGCPDDLYFISENDLPHKTKCYMDCEQCWEYVLKNKWK